MMANLFTDFRKSKSYTYMRRVNDIRNAIGYLEKISHRLDGLESSQTVNYMTISKKIIDDFLNNTQLGINTFESNLIIFGNFYTELVNKSDRLALDLSAMFKDYGKSEDVRYQNMNDLELLIDELIRISEYYQRKYLTFLG